MALDPTRVPLWVVTLPFISTGAVPQSKAGNVEKIEIRNRGRNKVRKRERYIYIYIYNYQRVRQHSLCRVGACCSTYSIQNFHGFSINWLSEGSTSRFTYKEQQISSPG